MREKERGSGQLGMVSPSQGDELSIPGRVAHPFPLEVGSDMDSTMPSWLGPLWDSHQKQKMRKHGLTEKQSKTKIKAIPMGCHPPGTQL